MYAVGIHLSAETVPIRVPSVFLVVCGVSSVQVSGSLWSSHTDISDQSLDSGLRVEGPLAASKRFRG